MAPAVLGFGFSLYALFGYLVPAFAYPRTVDSLPASATPAAASFEGAAEIVGYQVSGSTPQPGQHVDVTLYWKPLAQTASPMQVFVHLVDSQGIIVAQRDTYPGLGNALSTSWQVGRMFVDTYRVFLSDTAYAPESLAIRVGLWNTAEDRPLLVGDSDSVAAGSVSLLPRSGDVPNPVRINFDNRVNLVGYSLDQRVVAPGSTLALTTYWRPVRPEADYWAFAHVVAADGQIWALADSVLQPPVTGWVPESTTIEVRPITLAPDTPPGQYVVLFGVTRVTPAGQDRLKVLADDGHEVDDHIELVKIKVEP
jgi:hypothetical protein